MGRARPDGQAKRAERGAIDVSFVVTSCDEAHPTSALLQLLSRSLSTAPFSHETLVVDDASRDGTLDVLRGWSERFDGLSCVQHGRARGAGAAARTGVLLARGSRIVVLDAGLRPCVSGIAHVLDCLETSSDIVVGARKRAGAATGDGPLSLRTTRRLFSLAARAVLAGETPDLYAGIHAYRCHAARRIARLARVESSIYLAEWMALARRERFRVEEIEIHSRRSRRKSSVHRRSQLGALRELWGVRRDLNGFGYQHAWPEHMLLQDTAFVSVEELRRAAGGRPRSR